MRPAALFGCFTGTSLVAAVAAYALGDHYAAQWLFLATIAFLAQLVAWWRV